MEKDLVARKERENLNTKGNKLPKILELPEFDLPQQAVDEESRLFSRQHSRALQQGTKQEEIESKSYGIGSNSRAIE